MMKKRGVTSLIMLMTIISLIMVGCCHADNVSPQPAKDDIMLVIRLDVKEDIGLLIIDSKMNDVETSGGISNAEKTPLKHNETLYWTLSRRDYGDPEDTVNLTVRFRVITEYCEPNYDNNYPEDYTVLLDARSFTAEYGKSYSLTIIGDKINGYQAILESPEKLIDADPV